MLNFKTYLNLGIWGLKTSLQPPGPPGPNPSSDSDKKDLILCRIII